MVCLVAAKVGYGNFIFQVVLDKSKSHANLSAKMLDSDARLVGPIAAEGSQSSPFRNSGRRWSAVVALLHLEFWAEDVH